MTEATPTSSTSQLPPPFPLDDQSARYYIRKNVLYYRTKDKPKNPTGIYISKDTTISYTQFEGKDITVKGKFVLEREQVQCIHAPCPPLDSTVIHLDSVSLK